MATSRILYSVLWPPSVFSQAFHHPFPRECSPYCEYQQESVPYTFPVLDEMEQARAPCSYSEVNLVRNGLES